MSNPWNLCFDLIMSARFFLQKRDRSQFSKLYNNTNMCQLVKKFEGGGSSAFCRCHTGQFAAMSAAKCGRFSAYFGHNFRPVTHYNINNNMVIERWNTVEDNRRVNIHIYHEATDTCRGLFFKSWANNRFLFLKMQEVPRRIGQIFILRSDRRENSIKITLMARFIYNF